MSSVLSCLPESRKRRFDFQGGIDGVLRPALAAIPAIAIGGAQHIQTDVGVSSDPGPLNVNQVLGVCFSTSSNKRAPRIPK